VEHPAVNEVLQTDAVFPQIMMHELRDAIYKPNLTSSPGQDGIPVACLRILYERKRFFLLDLVNKYFRDFPDLWKLGVLYPVPKPTGGFRPIALLSQLGKVIERIAAAKIQDSSRLFPKSQFGCRAGVSVDLVVYSFITLRS
jgi:hypothetical protein